MNTTWNHYISQIEIDHETAKKWVGSVHCWDRFFLGRRWYHAIGRKTSALVELPFSLAQLTLSGIITSLNQLPKHSPARLPWVWMHVASVVWSHLTHKVTNSLWTSITSHQLTNSYNGPSIANADLYLTENKQSQSSNLWGFFSIGALSPNVSFKNAGGECHGQTLLFSKLYFELEKVIQDPEMRAYKIAQLFCKGSPSIATILQSLIAATYPRKCMLNMRIFHPRTPLSLLISWVQSAISQIFLGKHEESGLKRGTMNSMQCLTRAAGEGIRWRNYIILPWLGLAQNGMFTTPNRKWVFLQQGLNPKNVDPMPDTWKKIPLGVYQFNVTSSLLRLRRTFKSHSMVYIKASETLGLVYDPNYGLSRFEGTNHIQKISPLYGSFAPELALFRIHRKGLFDGSNLFNTVAWLLRG